MLPIQRFLFGVERSMSFDRRVMTEKRTYLRPLQHGDREMFIKMAQASRRFHAPWVSAPSAPEAFLSYLGRTRTDRLVALLLCSKADDQLVGVFNLSEIVRGLFQNAYLGYYVNAAFAGQGLMTEGMQLTLRYAFRTLKLHRLEANIRPGNVASLRLVQRCGFHKEGFSPKYLKIGGRWCDHERWAIRSDSWPSRRH